MVSEVLSEVALSFPFEGVLRSSCATRFAGSTDVFVFPWDVCLLFGEVVLRRLDRLFLVKTSSAGMEAVRRLLRNLEPMVPAASKLSSSAPKGTASVPQNQAS